MNAPAKQAMNRALPLTHELSVNLSETDTDTDPDPQHSQISYIEQLENDLKDFRLASRELEIELESELEASEKREQTLKSQLADLKAELEYERERNSKQAQEYEVCRGRLTSQLDQLTTRLDHAQENLRSIEIENDQMARSGRAHESLLEQYISQNSELLEQLALAESDRLSHAEEYKCLEEQLQRTREELQEAHDELYRISSVNREEPAQKVLPTPYGFSSSKIYHGDADASVDTVSSREQEPGSGKASLRRMATMISQVGLLEQSVANVRRKMSTRRSSGIHVNGYESNRRSTSRSTSLASSDLSIPSLSNHSDGSTDVSKSRDTHQGSPAQPNTVIGSRRDKSLLRPKINSPNWHLTLQTEFSKAVPSANSAAAKLAASKPQYRPKKLAAAGHGQPIL